VAGSPALKGGGVAGGDESISAEDTNSSVPFQDFTASDIGMKNV
jgi:hypothetical protein